VNGTPEMTANDAPSPFVVSVSNHTDTYDAWYLFDRSSDGWYYGSADVPQWIKIDVGEGNSISIIKYVLTSQPNNSSYPGMPTEWTLSGSNDDSNWTSIDSKTGVAGWGNSETREYEVSPASASYRYIKLNMTVKEDGPYGWQMSEFNIISVIQGYAGGTSTDDGGAGGGGASEVGANTSTGDGSAGGDGVANSISGSSVTYAGGGGGGAYSGTGGAGGSGGGGAGGDPDEDGVAGTANTGGGGGGAGGGANAARAGAAGGSGIVIIRYQYQ